MLSADFLDLGKDIELVNRYADLFHLDVMDGTFVPNISFGFPVINALAKKAEKPLDVHLMIVNPEKYVERFAKESHASMISFHYEAAREKSSDVIRLIRECGVKPGIVINPDCPVESIFQYLDEVDFVLIMSVFAGFGGQKFIDDSHSRIRHLKAEIDRRGLGVKIEVDGGVDPSNAPELIRDGADILVAGSSVFRAPDPVKAIAQLRGE